MNNIYTKEFINLAEKIQGEIEPKPGMWCFLKGLEDFGPEMIVDMKGTSIDTRKYVGNYLGSCYRREHYILLPDLGWLVDRKEFVSLSRQRTDSGGFEYRAETRSGGRGKICFASCPLLAALKALCKIKGVL